ncbi:hypothetical protein NQ317_008294 [Molorchus minor]|uniref:Reverse transcriptase domain-containing protein n=1 Tax=Molorchus minor TaxID=1323400 RepID=A0ABQ9ISA3_9CUCU|nr:hypothetical protein NQ317_008294 [Molorchus minor]
MKAQAKLGINWPLNCLEPRFRGGSGTAKKLTGIASFRTSEWSGLKMGKRRRESTTESSDSSSEDETSRLRRKLRRYKRKYGRKIRSVTPDSEKENGEAGRSRESSLEPDTGARTISEVFLPVDDQITSEEVGDPLSLDEIVPLDEGILKLLGSEDSVKAKIADSIHSDLAVRWETILKNGLDDALKLDLITKYPPVKNCVLMAAPKLNMEVKAAISEINLRRDERLAKVQAQSLCIRQGIKYLIRRKGGGETKLKLIEIVSDSARLLADVHYQESQTRRNILCLGLKKGFTSTLSDVTVDGWLFGENLGEREFFKLQRTVQVHTEQSPGRSTILRARQQTRGEQQKSSGSQTFMEQPRQTEKNIEVAQVRFRAGRLSSHVEVWKRITKDPIILSWVKGYTIPFSKKVKQYCLPSLPKWSDSEKQFINSEILRLLDLEVNHFKLEDKQTVCRLISRGCFMATIDIQDAYFLITINPRCRKYLRFRFENNMYEFNCVPFGLSSAPFLYTKIMKPVVSSLREKGFLSVSYLDDLLLIGDSYDKCRDNIKNTVNLLESLGFVINWKKSRLIPRTSCKFLVKHIKCYNDCQAKKRCNIREFARVVGVIVSNCPAVKYGWLYTKNLSVLNT